jgi:hypothetical protein
MARQTSCRGLGYSLKTVRQFRYFVLDSLEGCAYVDTCAFTRVCACLPGQRRLYE